MEARTTIAGKADIEISSEDQAFEAISKTVDVMPGLNSYQIDFAIENPKLWWPNGMGEQPLYKIVTTLFINKKFPAQTSRRIALRAIELRQSDDAWGRSFDFIVNGVPVFAKGGNWIPADNFLSRVDKSRYAHLLNSVTAANMNMLRVWGGGIYENDEFYNLCDELGIMIWQDFMFACSMYPAEAKDLAGIEAEATHQVKRLRIRPQCMGALYWQINDCWPVASWSSIDYYGRWKALHYYAKKFFAPILVSLHEKNGKVDIYVVSDYRESMAVDLRAVLMDFDGKIIKEITKNIWVRESASETYLTLDKKEWLGGNDDRNIFLFVQVCDEALSLSTNTHFFRPAKELNLPRPSITTNVTKSISGFKIALQSDKLAKHVFLSSGEHEGFFTDNYFHLLPGQAVEIAFQTEERIELETFNQDLAVRSLVDAFAPKSTL